MKRVKSVFFQEKKKLVDPGKASGFSEIQRLIVRTPLELLIFFLIILARYMMKYQKVKIGKNFYCSKKNIWSKISIFIVAGPNLVRPTLLNLTDRTVWFINGVEELFFALGIKQTLNHYGPTLCNSLFETDYTPYMG